MSCFVVSDECMTAAVNAIWHLHAFKPFTFGPIVVTSESDLQALATALYRLNVEAVNGRYAHHDEAEPIPFYRFPGVCDFFDGQGIARAKQLCALHYQCAEDASDGKPLYDALTKLVERVWSKLDTKCPEFKAAAWG